MKSALSSRFTLLLALPGIAAAAAVDSEKDWAERSRAPGVLIAEGFDDIQAWARYSWDKAGCNADYQVRVNGSLAGCRNNAWDSAVRSSGKGSVRFDILPRTSEGGGGNIVIPFGDFATRQFGANSDLWVSWRQKMDARFIAGFHTPEGRIANFKQVIIAQGDIPIPGGSKMVEGQACSENQVVVVASTPHQGSAHPIGYIECARYRPFEQALRAGQYAGDARGSTAITRQNMPSSDTGSSRRTVSAALTSTPAWIRRWTAVKSPRSAARQSWYSGGGPARASEESRRSMGPLRGPLSGSPAHGVSPADRPGPGPPRSGSRGRPRSG